jgi:hypothetical protein
VLHHPVHDVPAITEPLHISAMDQLLGAQSMYSGLHGKLRCHSGVCCAICCRGPAAKAAKAAKPAASRKRKSKQQEGDQEQQQQQQQQDEEHEEPDSKRAEGKSSIAKAQSESSGGCDS